MDRIIAAAGIALLIAAAAVYPEDPPTTQLTLGSFVTDRAQRN